MVESKISATFFYQNINLVVLIKKIKCYYNFGGLKMKNIFRIIIFLTAILFIILGIKNNENKRVMNKGNIICLECVGIG